VQFKLNDAGDGALQNRQMPVRALNQVMDFMSRDGLGYTNPRESKEWGQNARKQKKTRLENGLMSC